MTADTITIDGGIFLSGTIIAQSAEIYSTFESVTPMLRWSKDGKLQQQWHVVEHQLGVLGCEKERFEWRDVPVEV